MTSYGKGIGGNADFKVLCEIRGVNSKHFDAKFFLPSKHIGVESDLRKIAKEKISRGRLEVFFRYEDLSKKSVIGKSKEEISRILDEMIDLADSKNIKLSVSASDMLKLVSYVGENAGLEEINYDVEFTAYKDALSSALQAFIRVKEEEGLAMKNELIKLLAKAKDKIIIIEKRAPEMVSIYRDKLFERVEKLLNGKDVNELSVINEVSVIADKTDVREEIVRFFTHVDKFTKLMETNGAIGKNLDFLAQEMHREVNTIGSKTQDIQISAMVVELKSIVEQIREQIQNIE